MLRLGLKELRNAANPSRESVADNEVGLYGTQTQGEIAAARGGPGKGPEQESPNGKLSLADLRRDAKELGHGEDDRRKGHDHGHDHDDLER
jgi:hypothetical protein